MSQINFEIFNEYKSVDNICKDMYSSEKGVTTYIDNMNNVSTFETNSIPNWNETKTMLVRIRKLRNDMAHEDGAFEYSDGTKKDLEWLKEFHEKLLNQTDPLCLLYKKRNENNNLRSSKNNTDSHVSINRGTGIDSNIKSTGGGCLVAAITIIVIASALLAGTGMVMAGIIYISM